MAKIPRGSGGSAPGLAPLLSDWLISLEGTEAGHRLALGLALWAAVLHALFGALQKGRHDPWLSRAAIDASYGVIALPVALFVVPWPEPHLWPILAGAFVIHAGYKLAQAATYSRGAYTVVYPVVRGTGPLFAVIGAGLVFGEHFSPGQWIGLAMLLAGIYGLAVYNLRNVTEARDTMVPALALAVVTGGFVAVAWSDLFQGILMALGLTVLPLAAWFVLAPPAGTELSCQQGATRLVGRYAQAGSSPSGSPPGRCGLPRRTGRHPRAGSLRRFSVRSPIRRWRRRDNHDKRRNHDDYTS